MLKTYENYLNDNFKEIKNKYSKLLKIVNFIEKYNLKDFIISAEEGDYMFAGIYIKNGKYFLDYEYYYDNKSIQKKTELSKLDNDVVDNLLKACEENDRFDIETHLEMGITDIDTFITILKKYKKPIKFTQWMISLLLEYNLENEANKFEFQDILFDTHPESFEIFMDECIDSQRRSKGEWEPLRLAPGIKEKYKNLYDKYELKQNAKKFNV